MSNTPRTRKATAARKAAKRPAKAAAPALESVEEVPAPPANGMAEWQALELVAQTVGLASLPLAQHMQVQAALHTLSAHLVATCGAPAVPPAGD